LERGIAREDSKENLPGVLGFGSLPDAATYFHFSPTTYSFSASIPVAPGVSMAQTGTKLRQQVAIPQTGNLTVYD
jgi:hypothetical protein